MSGNNKVILITGASSGVGKCAAEYLSQNGYKVYGTSRKIERNKFIEIGSHNNGGFLKMINLEARSDESVAEAVNHIVSKENTIDILINCPGYALAGAIEDTSADEACDEFNTNFFGVIRTCRNVLPIMRENGGGTIINIGSVAGLISIPFQSMYSASKYALESMTESLRMEVKKYNIKVALVDPGDIKTGFTDSRVFTRASGENSAYAEKLKKSVNSMIKSEQNGPPPDKAVKAIEKIINMSNPPIHIVVGTSYKLLAILKKFLPSRLTEFVVSKLY